MPTPVLVAFIVVAVVLSSWAGHLLVLRILRWRGVTVTRTMFGTTFIFDATDEDGTPVRLLNVGGAFQSACYVEDSLAYELVCEYQRAEADIVASLPTLRDVAFIGGGGFSFPKWVLRHLPPVRVAVAEIDPKIIDIARRSFHLADAECRYVPEGRLTIACEDGWEWLRGLEQPVDLIVNEAFSGRHPLGPLTGEEGAGLVHEKLANGGTYLANVRCPLEGRRSAALRGTADAFGREFAHVWVVPERPQEPTVAGNNTLVASDCDLVTAGCAALAGHEWAGTPEASRGGGGRRAGRRQPYWP